MIHFSICKLDPEGQKMKQLKRTIRGKLPFHPWDYWGDHEDEEEQFEGILGGVAVRQLVEGAVHYIHIHQVLKE